MKKSKISLTICLLIVIFSCAKNENDGRLSNDGAILFGIDNIIQTKVDYSDPNGTDLPIKAEFEEGDEIGVYAYYNYYYADNAESVIFANQQLTVDVNKNPTYSPLKSWSFSTIYSDHFLNRFDCIAYYPFNDEDSSPVTLTHNEDGAEILEYKYVNGSTVNAKSDFMTALQPYQADNAEEFRDKILNLNNIPLKFTRQTASLNFRVTKPVGHAAITVVGVTVHFDAETRFTQIVGDGTINWSDKQTQLTCSTACNKTLDDTEWNGTPDEDLAYNIDNLLDDNNMFFFPPDTEINKVVFTLSDKSNYTWHPHVDRIEANRHYTLNLELDPDRKN